MNRISIWFAAAAMILLGVGLLSPWLVPNQGLTMQARGTTCFVQPSLLCKGLALVFCGFTFLYSMWKVPWSARAAAWHLGLSLMAVTLFVVGFAPLARFQALDRPAGPLSPGVQAMLAGFVLGPALFAVVQGWFVMDSLRRIWLFWTRTLAP